MDNINENSEFSDQKFEDLVEETLDNIEGEEGICEAIKRKIEGSKRYLGIVAVVVTVFNLGVFAYFQATKPVEVAGIESVNEHQLPPEVEAEIKPLVDFVQSMDQINPHVVGMRMQDHIMALESDASKGEDKDVFFPPVSDLQFKDDGEIKLLSANAQ